MDNLSSGSAIKIEDLFNLNNFQLVNQDVAEYQPWRAFDEQLDRRPRFQEIYYLASHSHDVMAMYDAHIRGLHNALDIANFHRCSLLILSLPHSCKKLNTSEASGAYYYTKKAGESIARSYQAKFRISLTVVECDDVGSNDISDVLIASMRGN